MPNHFRAVQQAWDWAWVHGFRRIGLALFDEPGAIDVQDRTAAFLERQQHAAAEQRVPMLAVMPWMRDDVPFQPGRIPYSDAVARMRAWIRAERPEIVLGFNDIFRWLLRDAEKRMSHPTAFIDLWIGTPDPALTGLRLYADELGRRAVDWLDSLLRMGEHGVPEQPATMEIDFVWQDGAALPHLARQSHTTPFQRNSP